MDKKYIIKNCPSYNKTLGQGIGSCLDRYKLHCESISDCLLKTIVKLCQEEKEPICTIDDDNGTSTSYYKNDIYLANKILEALEIEEINVENN